MSKKDPARTDPASEPAPDEIETGGEAGADPAVEPIDADEQPLRESQQPEQGGQGPEQSEIEQLRAELEEAEDRALRTQAELENYRKRVARQTQEERRYANVALLRDLLPVWDNMGRAIEAAEKTHDTASLLEGFKMVAGQLEGVLQQHHCIKINALGEPFDPNLHEAISQQPSSEHPANTVLGVAQIGFRLHDRVIRPSRVIVSAPVPEKQQPPQAEEVSADEPEQTAHRQDPDAGS